MKTKIINAGALCTPSKLPASDYVINPYVGCIHRCRYCYARFMGRFTGHWEEWGTYIDCKKYDSYRLPNNLEGKTILIGSVTDAYNPAESRFRLMPDILKALSECPAHVEILTKSKLVLRDVEYIKKIPDIAVGVSLSNLNEQDNRVIEPGAASAEERIKILQVLHDAGIKTYLFVAPYLPGITNLPGLFEAVKTCVDYICMENLNLRGEYKQPMLQFAQQYHSNVYALWEKIYLRKQGDDYWCDVEKQFESLGKVYDIPVISYMYHEKIKKK